MFSSILLWGFGLLVLVVLAYFFAPKALKRFTETGAAKLNQAGTTTWNNNAEAVLQLRLDHSADEVAEASKGLQQYQALLAQVKRQVETGTKTCANLEALVKRYLSNNDEDKAAEYAQQLNTEREHLETNQKQLASYSAGYQNNLKKIKAARDKITAVRQEATKKGAELRMSKAEAELADLAQKFNVRGAALDGVGEVLDELDRQIDINRGKAQVVADLSADGIADIEAEEAEKKEAAKATLEEFKKKMNTNNAVSI